MSHLRSMQQAQRADLAGIVTAAQRPHDTATQLAEELRTWEAQATDELSRSLAMQRLCVEDLADLEAQDALGQADAAGVVSSRLASYQELCRTIEHQRQVRQELLLQWARARALSRRTKDPAEDAR